MPSLNKVTIIGNVGNEPEMRFTPNGKPVTSFSVATNWVYTSPEGERRQETEWFNVVAWNRLAEQCNQFLGKGKLVYAEGRIHTRNWEGQDGQPHSRIEVIANRVDTFCILFECTVIVGQKSFSEKPCYAAEQKNEKRFSGLGIP